MTPAYRLARIALPVALLFVTPSAAAQPPRTRDIPRLAIAPARPSPELTAARRLVDRALTIRLARLPARLNMEKFNRWVARTLRRFIETKRAAIAAADQALVPLRQSATPREHAVSAALHAVMYDDFAMRILALPPPLELQRDPQLAAAYRQALESVVAPIAQAAVAGYQACLLQPDLAPDWTAFCQTRLALVTPAAAGAAPPRGLLPGIP